MFDNKRVDAEADTACGRGDSAFLLAHEYRYTQQGLMESEFDVNAYGCVNTWGRRDYQSGVSWEESSTPTSEEIDHVRTSSVD